METHSSILAWKIPWTEETGGLQSLGLQRVGQTEQLTLSLSLYSSLYSSIQLGDCHRANAWLVVKYTILVKHGNRPFPGLNNVAGWRMKLKWLLLFP